MIIDYAVLAHDHADATEVINELSSWVRDNVFDNTTMTVDFDSAVLFRWDVSVRLTVVPTSFTYEGRFFGSVVSLISSEAYHERATAACWDILVAIAAYRPMPTWLRADVWTQERLSNFPSMQPLAIASNQGYVLNAADFSRLTGD